MTEMLRRTGSIIPDWPAASQGNVEQVLTFR